MRVLWNSEDGWKSYIHYEFAWRWIPTHHDSLEDRQKLLWKWDKGDKGQETEEWVDEETRKWRTGREWQGGEVEEHNQGDNQY